MRTEPGSASRDARQSVTVEGVELHPFDPPHLDSALEKLRYYRDGVVRVNLTPAEATAILLALRRLPEDGAANLAGWWREEYLRVMATAE